ncbi:MAG: membrane integrity-associated transporter subunit PqiC [Deltaproteobacteria bacterium]|nr:membrane integrity-associated transporter subunit PqiC [Deltaproteobacteria bacterium]
MKEYFPSRRQSPSRFPAILPAILCGFLTLALLLTGCGKPPVAVYKHLLEYPSPELPRLPQVPEGLKVELFSVAQAFNSQAMIYRPTSYQSEAYRYHRWRVNPGQLVTDFLLRDLRQSRVFAAVFGYERTATPRFLLEGAVEEFQEVNAGDSWSAVLAVNITLLDTTKEEITQRVLFQKNYRAEEPIMDRTPQGLAAAMSRAMEKLSTTIITDVHQAAWKRIPPKERK